MNSQNLSEFSDEQLQKKYREVKNGKIVNAFIIGITVGIYLYSSVKKGFGLINFFPVAIAYLIVRNSRNNDILGKEIEKQLQLRNQK